MNKRQEKIILFLEDSKKWITGKELSSLLSVSDRTIRTDIDSINKVYPRLIESNIRYGYHINQEVFVKQKITVGKLIPQTPQERSIYILQELLFNQNEINLTFLQEEVFVSGYSIDNDLKKIKTILLPYSGLKLERKKNYITLIGSEEDKRSLYKDLLSKETKGNFINLNTIAQLYHEFDLLEIKNILENTFNEYNFKLREETFPMVMIHIGVALERMLRQHYIKTDYKTSELVLSNEYAIAKDFFDAVSRKLYIEVNEDEVALIALLLLGKRSVDYTSQIVKEKALFDIDSLINTIIEDLKKNFDIDFKKDKTFIVGLRLHIQNLIERIEKNMIINNIYLTEIKRKYPLVFEMSIFVSKIIESATGNKVSEDEIGYLSLHLGAAYDRLDLNKKHNAILIHPNNQTLTSMCAKKVDDRFHDRMYIENVLNYFEASVVESYDPDLIISTVPLKHNLNIPTISISLFVNNDDEFKIFQALNELDKKRSKQYFEDLIQELITEDFFFANCPGNTPTEVISFMCNKLEDKKLVDRGFKDSVLQREEIASTSFNYGFAVPHTLNFPANKSVISIAVLKNSIEWGSYDVRLVILLAINENDRKLLGIFFDWLSNITSDSSILSSLLETTTCTEFISYILE